MILAAPHDKTIFSLTATAPFNGLVNEALQFGTAVASIQETSKSSGIYPLASQLTEYRIDAYSPAEYETFLKNQETSLKSIPKFPKAALQGLSEIYISNVATLLSANEKKLLTADGITEDSLEEIYNLVQSFLEIDNEPDKSEDAETNLTEETQE